MSSAKWKNLSLEEAFVISLIYIRNNNGPNTEPCGTPYGLGSFELLKPLISMDCVLFKRYDSNQLLVIPLIP